MATAKTSKKQTKPASTRSKAPKPAKPKNESAPKEELCVFAFRLTPAERDAIHKTAGPARASKFVRRVAVAFANEDEPAFRGVLKEAGEARS